MMKLLKHKKAVNDMTMMWTIIVVLFSLGAFVPIIEGYFSGTSTEYDTDAVREDVGVGLPTSEGDANTVNAIEVVGSIVAMFFWSFNVIWWVNLIILEPMRIILYILIYRLVRSGAG